MSRKKKKPEEKKAKLLSVLETNNLHMKCINSNINKNKNKNFVYFINIFFRTQHVRGKSIQLPFGVVRDKAKEKFIKLNLPPDLRKDVLFDHLPYLRHLENPVIKDVIKNGIMDNLALQKYLLANGLLKDSIQDSLDMIVIDGKFNSASVRRVLDTKYPSVMKNSNPIDVIFKDKAKYDTQNPIIGTLLTDNKHSNIV